MGWCDLGVFLRLTLCNEGRKYFKRSKGLVMDEFAPILLLKKAFHYYSQSTSRVTIIS